MRLIQSIGCNKIVNLQQKCNEFVIYNAESVVSVHNRKWIQSPVVHDYSGWYTKT